MAIKSTTQYLTDLTKNVKNPLTQTSAVDKAVTNMQNTPVQKTVVPMGVRAVTTGDTSKTSNTSCPRPTTRWNLNAARMVRTA